MNPPFPSVPTELQAAIECYQTALKCLDCSNTLLSKEQALNILLARDALQKVLETEALIPVNLWPELIEQDARLKKQAYQITQVLDLPEYRDTLPISSQKWWWNLEAVGEPPPGNRWDWLWKAARSLLWTVNLGLLGTLATRFLSGGSGLLEVVAIALPSALALLQANSELTPSGQESLDKLLDRLKIPHHKYEKVKLVPTGSLFLLLIVIWGLQPQIAKRLNQEGLNEQARGQLATAERKYLKALAFNWENLDANYNLGDLYEELQDVDSARKYYLIAAKGGIPEAYNNLARLYIQQQKYPEAVTLLKEGLAVIDRQEREVGKKPDNLPEVKYSLFKNLGWARLMQKQNEEAKDYLKVALSLASNPQTQQYILNPGASYCLLAQVLERERQKPAQETLAYWQQCQKLIEDRLAAGTSINPEEDTWLSVAKHELKTASQGGSKP